MKIAVLSDIHGNINALETVLGEFWEDESFEKILFLGDYCHAGPCPDATAFFCQQLSENPRYEFIQGNTDKMIADYSEEVYENLAKDFPVMANALQSDVKLIKDSEKEFLANLPEQKMLELNGVKVLMVHGSPRKQNENIYSTLPIEDIEEMISGTDADLILCGHTHIPCGIQTTTNQTIVNVGSVGRPFTQDAMPCYVTIEINDDKSFEVKHHFVNYDVDGTVRDLLARDYDGVEKLAEIIKNPEKRHV